MTFLEALAYMHSRGIVLPDEYYGQMTARQRRRAFSVAGLASLEQVKHVANELSKVLDNGGTFADFQKGIESGDIKVQLPRHRWDNIFRTNIQASYNQGRWQQQQINKNSRPYLMYDAVNDSRTRPSHSALDGTIRHIDDPIWERIYPPIDFRCRCIVRALTEQQANDKGGESDISNIELVQNGWGNQRTYDTVLADRIDAWGANVKITTPSNIQEMQSAKERLKREYGDIEYIAGTAYDQKVKPRTNLELYGQEIKRTPEEAKQIFADAMEKLDDGWGNLDEYSLIELSESEYSRDAEKLGHFSARYGEKLNYFSKSLVKFDGQILSKTSSGLQIPIYLNSSVLSSDEAIIQILYHEIYEIEELRYLIATGVSIKAFYDMIRGDLYGNLHYHAVIESDRILERYREN